MVGTRKRGKMKYIQVSTRRPIGRQFMGWAVYAPSEYPLRGSRASARQRAVLRTFPQGSCSLPYIGSAWLCGARRVLRGCHGVSVVLRESFRGSGRAAHPMNWHPRPTGIYDMYGSQALTHSLT